MAMSKKAIDRRVPRTRALLQQGLCALLRKKRYEAITINDICTAANVGRSTFYAHYKSKDDLKRSGLNSLHGILAQRQNAARGDAGDPRDRGFDFSLSVFEHARDHLDHYQTLVGGRGGAVALAKVREMVRDLARNELALTVTRRSTEEIPLEAIVEYVVGAYMALLTWWLDNGAKLPPKRLDAMFRQLTTQGIVG
jgi:AcrR family transcriptional regulator